MNYQRKMRQELGLPEEMMFLMITAFVFNGTPFLTSITDIGLVDNYAQIVLPLVVATRPA